jgi:hypothetical protein
MPICKCENENDKLNCYVNQCNLVSMVTLVMILAASFCYTCICQIDHTGLIIMRITYVQMS